MVLTMNNLGVYIAQQRQKLGISQAALAKKVGIDRATLSMIEGGHRLDPKFSTIIGLTYALKCDPMEMVLAFKGKDPGVLRNPEAKEAQAIQEILTVLKDKGLL